MPAQDPREVLVRQLFTLERLANGLVHDSNRVLRAAFEEIVGELAKIDPTAVSLRYRKDRVDRLIARARAILGDTYADWLAQQRTELARLGAYQAEQTTLHLRAVLSAGNAGRVASTTGLSVNHFKAILDAEPVQGAVLKDWAADQKRRTLFRFSQQVKLGVANGEPLDAIVRRVRGRAVGKGRYAGGVMQTTTREAEALVRTAVADISTHARHGTYAANEDILEGYTLVVTFDGRTSDTCIRYGLTPAKVYPLNDPTSPRPPFHFQCRTVTAPAVNWRALGIEPPAPGTRASATGQVPAAWDFDAWLKQAPPGIQADILGSGRAKLYREGRVSLRDLYKSDGRRVRLDDLRSAA